MTSLKCDWFFIVLYIRVSPIHRRWEKSDKKTTVISEFSYEQKIDGIDFGCCADTVYSTTQTGTESHQAGDR